MKHNHNSEYADVENITKPQIQEVNQQMAYLQLSVQNKMILTGDISNFLYTFCLQNITVTQKKLHFKISHVCSVYHLLPMD